MNKKHDPLLWAALRIERCLAARAGRGAFRLSDELILLVDRQDALQCAWLRFEAARARDWPLAAGRLREQLLSQIQRLQQSAQEVLSRAQEPKPQVPSLHDLLADLRQLEDEFEHVDVLPKHNMLVAHTPPIELEDLALGSFAIELHLDRLNNRLGSECFTCVALEPNPSSANDSVTHPHVRDKALCAGDAAVPIATALADGRIADAFCLIQSVLQTYNRESPYVSIENWHGVQCQNCDATVDSDEINHCDSCGKDFCDSCFSCCNLCGESCCCSCLEFDRVSDRHCCSECRHTCSKCGRIVDCDSFDDETELCPGCLAEQQEQEEPSEPPLQENDHDPIPTTQESQAATTA